MTPEERRRVDELFDRLASLEAAPRDRDAEQAIAEGLRRAPNAAYALVQTALVQDEALRAAEARIAELEQAGGGAASEAPRGFLDSMREQIFGREERRGSVPSVGAGGRFGGSMNRADDARAASGGGSFLGTAAAAAAGVIGGSLLMNSLGGMFGQSKQGQSMFDTANANGSEKSSGPWSDNSGNTGGDLARDAGLSDVGNRNESRQGLFDSSGDNSHRNEQAAADSGHGGDEFDAAGFDGFDFDSDFG